MSINPKPLTLSLPVLGPTETIRYYKVARDAVTGQFVTLDYAHLNPDTTIIQTIPRIVKKKGERNLYV